MFNMIHMNVRCEKIWILYISGVKKNFKCSLVLRTSTPKFYLSYCQKTLGIQGNITLHCFFYLPVVHWKKIYACSC